MFNDELFSLKTLQEFHEEQQNAHREEMERLKASAAEARNETVRWQSDDIGKLTTPATNAK